MKEAFFQGKFVPFADAKISIMTHAFNYGTGVFEGIRGYWNPALKKMFILQARDHFERMKRSCKIMRIGLRYSVDELVGMTLELAKRNGYQEDIYIRPLAYKSSTVVGVRLHDLEDDFCMFISPFGAYLDTAQGIRMCTSSWRRIDDNTIPARAKITGAYVNSAFSKTEAMEGGFAEAIVLTLDGHVAEGSAENIFILRDGVLITPPPSDGILEGITRQTLIRMAADELGLKTVERSIDRTELYIADEVFLCGTGAQVTPVVEIDRRPVGEGIVGPVTSKLHQLYFEAVRGDNPKYESLLISAY